MGFCQVQRVLKHLKQSFRVSGVHASPLKLIDDELLFGDTLLAVGDDALSFCKVLVEIRRHQPQPSALAAVQHPFA